MAPARKKVDMLLINPPFFQAVDRNVTYYAPPPGLQYIAAILERDGYSVELYNPVFENKYIQLRDPVFPPMTDRARREFKDSVLGFPGSPEWLRMEIELAGYEPSVVGISVKSALLDSAIRLAGIVREQNPGVPVVAGGVHPSVLPEETIARPEFDIVVYGEGEYTSLELMDVFARKTRKLSGVKGIYYKQGDRIVRNPPREPIEDLDALPFPTCGPAGEEQSWRPLFTSRGCYFNCTFCAQTSIHGHRIRFRSPGNVVDEIESWYRRGTRQFIIYDSAFASRSDYAASLMDLIVERGLDISWGFQTRVDFIRRDLVSRARDSGCDYIWVGVESGDPDILRAIDKNITREQVKEAVGVIGEYGIETHANFIFGFEDDTADSMRATRDFAIELEGCEPYFYISTPFPGSGSFDSLAASDRLLTRDYFCYFWWYPDVFRHKNLSNGEVWESYLEAMDYWNGWKIQDLPGK